MSRARTAALAGSASAILLAASIAAPNVMRSEGWRNDPYFDTAGVLTVCGGETANVERRRYSDAECMGMFLVSLVRHGNSIAGCLPADLPPGVRAEFTDMAYNIGPPAFCRSSMSRKALAGDLAGACASFSLYVYAGTRDGRPRDCRIQYPGDRNNCPGIPIRRAEQRARCEAALAAGA